MALMWKKCFLFWVFALHSLCGDSHSSGVNYRTKTLLQSSGSHDFKIDPQDLLAMESENVHVKHQAVVLPPPGFMNVTNYGTEVPHPLNKNLTSGQKSGNNGTNMTDYSSENSKANEFSNTTIPPTETTINPNLTKDDAVTANNTFRNISSDVLESINESNLKDVYNPESSTISEIDTNVNETELPIILANLNKTDQHKHKKVLVPEVNTEETPMALTGNLSLSSNNKTLFIEAKNETSETINSKPITAPPDNKVTENNETTTLDYESSNVINSTEMPLNDANLTTENTEGYSQNPITTKLPILTKREAHLPENVTTLIPILGTEESENTTQLGEMTTPQNSRFSLKFRREKIVTINGAEPRRINEEIEHSQDERYWNTEHFLPRNLMAKESILTETEKDYLKESEALTLPTRVDEVTELPEIRDIFEASESRTPKPVTLEDIIYRVKAEDDVESPMIGQASQQVSRVVSTRLKATPSKRRYSKKHEEGYHKGGGKSGKKGYEKSKGYKGNHYGDYGKKENSGYKDRGGKKYRGRDHKENYYGKKDAGKKGAKGHSFGKKGRRNKGHSNKGHKTISHKEEYHVTKKFYDDADDSDFHKKYDDFDSYFKQNKGDSKKGNSFEGNKAHDNHGKKDFHKEGKFFDDHAGKKSKYAKDGHYANNDKHGHKGNFEKGHASNSGKKPHGGGHGGHHNGGFRSHIDHGGFGGHGFEHGSHSERRPVSVPRRREYAEERDPRERIHEDRESRRYEDREEYYERDEDPKYRREESRGRSYEEKPDDRRHRRREDDRYYEDEDERRYRNRHREKDRYEDEREERRPHRHRPRYNDIDNRDDKERYYEEAKLEVDILPEDEDEDEKLSYYEQDANRRKQENRRLLNRPEAFTKFQSFAPKKELIEQGTDEVKRHFKEDKKKDNYYKQSPSIPEDVMVYNQPRRRVSYSEITHEDIYDTATPVKKESKKVKDEYPLPSKVLKLLELLPDLDVLEKIQNLTEAASTTPSSSEDKTTQAPFVEELKLAATELNKTESSTSTKAPETDLKTAKISIKEVSISTTQNTKPNKSTTPSPTVKTSKKKNPIIRRRNKKKKDTKLQKKSKNKTAESKKKSSKVKSPSSRQDDQKRKEKTDAIKNKVQAYLQKSVMPEVKNCTQDSNNCTTYTKQSSSSYVMEVLDSDYGVDIPLPNITFPDLEKYMEKGMSSVGLNDSGSKNSSGSKARTDSKTSPDYLGLGIFSVLDDDESKSEGKLTGSPTQNVTTKSVVYKSELKMNVFNTSSGDFGKRKLGRKKMLLPSNRTANMSSSRVKKIKGKNGKKKKNSKSKGKKRKGKKNRRRKGRKGKKRRRKNKKNKKSVKIKDGSKSKAKETKKVKSTVTPSTFQDPRKRKIVRNKSVKTEKKKKSSKKDNKSTEKKYRAKKIGLKRNDKLNEIKKAKENLKKKLDRRPFIVPPLKSKENKTVN